MGECLWRAQLCIALVLLDLVLQELEDSFGIGTCWRCLPRQLEDRFLCCMSSVAPLTHHAALCGRELD
jgi:hypothetical protein